MYKQLLSSKLGIDTDMVRLVDGDTDKVSHGLGTFGSRSAMVGGTALHLAADKIIEKGIKIASDILETKWRKWTKNIKPIIETMKSSKDKKEKKEGENKDT